MKSKPISASCDCGSGRDYAQCCGPLHGGAPAPDAEALMRSRYAAYARGLVAYLQSSWHASHRPAQLELESDVQWLGLKVLTHTPLGADQAEVEFVARSRPGGGRARRLHERSRFVREQGQWYYVDGELIGAR